MICTATNIKINPCALKKSGKPVAFKFFTHSLKTLSFISPSITKDRHWVQNKLHLLWILNFDATFFNVIMIFTILQVCVHFHIQYSSSIPSLNSRAFISWHCKHSYLTHVVEKIPNTYYILWKFFGFCLSLH